MINERKTKWELGSAVSAGKKCHSLAKEHSTELLPRLQPGELEELEENTTELEARRSGQTEHLVEQKSKTIGQDEVINSLRGNVVSIRNIVKCSSSVSPEILKAYGVGEKIIPSISNVTASANIIVTAYKTFTEWSNSVGIIESDITEITSLVSQLSKAEELQGNAMFIRKSRTMDKNVLQRAVEDEVSKISALGKHIFRDSNPAVAKLFEDLIPTTAKVKNGADTEAKSTIKEKVSS